MDKRKRKKFVITMTVILIVLLTSGYFVITGKEPRQIVYSTTGTTYEYGAFGTTFFSKYDSTRDSNINNDIKQLLEQTGLDLFLDRANPMKEWRVYRIDYNTSERLGLELETMATESDVIEHYRSVLGPESVSRTSTGSYYDWRYNGLNNVTISIDPSRSSSGAIRVKVDFFRKHPLKTVEELKPTQQISPGN